MSGDEMMAMATAVYNRHFKGAKSLREDLIHEGVYGIIKGELKFDESKGVKKATFLWKCAWNAMAQFVKVEIKNRQYVIDADICDISDFLGEPEEDDFGFSLQEEMEEIRECTCVMRPKTNAIANDLLSGKKHKDIAEKYGVTRQRVSYIFRELKTRVLARYDYVDGQLIEKKVVNRNEQNY